MFLRLCYLWLQAHLRQRVQIAANSRKDQEDQTAPTVSTLEELQAAIAAAKDGDTIAISEEITLDAVTLETNKRIVIIRSDTYPSGTLIRLYNGSKNIWVHF